MPPVRPWLTLLVCLVAAGCVTTPPGEAPITATATLSDASGTPIGEAVFHQVPGGVHVVMHVRHLSPGAHGVHIHAVGHCDPPDFASAGPHFNPQRKQHGLLNELGPHAGDLPNITVDPDGTGRLESMDEHASLAEGGSSLLDIDGSALVIHADPDDFITDPDGNTGARIACGVIRRST